MVTQNQLTLIINREKFHFRSINEADVTEKYVEGLRRQTKYINARSDDITRHSQQVYVKKISDSVDDALFGLFYRTELIASSGVQGIRTKAAPAIGIFVFESSLRGRGFGKTLVWCASYLVNYVWGIQAFSAGMEKENIPSLKSFLSCGFIIKEESADMYTVGMDFSRLLCPEVISHVTIDELRR